VTHNITEREYGHLEGYLKALVDGNNLMLERMDGLDERMRKLEASHHMRVGKQSVISALLGGVMGFVAAWLKAHGFSLSS
jgi:hypothetical protein